MMKKILIVLMLLVMIPINVEAENTFKKATFAAAFDQSIELDQVGRIIIEMEIVPFDTSKSPFKYSVILFKDKNFKEEVYERLISGKINVLYVLVGDDYASTKYNTKVATNIGEDNTAFVQLVISPKEIKTSSTADKTVLDEIIKEHVLDEETKEIIESITTTKTTKNENTTQDSGTIVIGQDKTTKKKTDSSINKKTTTKINEMQEEKEKKKKRENTIFKILIFSILGILLIAGAYFGYKIYAASKLV